MAQARASESFAFATQDQSLTDALKLNCDAFRDAFCLNRGIITHDGLPFFLPVEMQAAIFGVILTAWELEMDRPGDLTSYTVRTRHAAIRGYNFYQERQPYYSNFLRLVRELARQPLFESYPLASHLTYPWLGGNLRLPNQQSEGERILGAEFMRNYYLQQLDWSMGILNLWNQVPFRNQEDLEDKLPFDGLAFHQMRPQLRFDAHLFPRPLRRASFWPDLNPAWFDLDQDCQVQEGSLPKSQER
jgi:hypothetical protein